MRETTRRGLVLAVIAAAGFQAAAAQAVILDNILPAALDQPQINLTVTLQGNTTPQTTDTQVFDLDTGNFVDARIFNIQGYFDTGASGILISGPTATAFSIPTIPDTYFYDVGVAGADIFQVSPVVSVKLTHYYQRTDLDQFADPGQTIPITSMYAPLAAPNNTGVRLQVGPYNPTAENPVLDFLSEFLEQYAAVDVIGMPAMKGQVVVIDPKPVNNFDQLMNIDIGTATEIPDVFMRTFAYAPGTPFKPSTQDTDPGIPTTNRHIKLSYASFDRFTQVTPTGAAGPTLEHNPFIGKNPVALLDGQSGGTTPGIKISRTANGQTLSVEGNWLLDTGAAASMISQSQANALGVFYKPGTYKTDAPILVDASGNEIANQFTLTIGGVGGQFTAAGFFLDSALVRTMEGDPANDLDPNHLLFTNAGVLVADITVKDPLTDQLLTLDGIFGMNFLTASVNLEAGDFLPTITDLTGGYFNWITFDEPNGILGLDVASLPPVPEPTTLPLLGIGALALLARRRKPLEPQHPEDSIVF